MDPTQVAEYARRKQRDVADRVATLVRRTATLYTVLGAALFLVGSGLAIVGVVSRLAVTGASEALLVVPLAAAPILVLLGATFFVVGRRLDPDTTRLLASGLAGRATLVDVGSGGMTITSGSGLSATRTKLVLDVEVGDGRPAYRVEHRTFVPLGSYRRLLPGTSFAVRVDPARPKRLAIVWQEHADGG